MISEIVSNKNWGEYSTLIPSHFYSRLQSGEAEALGVRFLEEPVGSIVWQQDTLLSIYVLPLARRLGVGKRLLSDLAALLKKREGSPLSFTYEEAEDRLSLTFFFNEMGIAIEPIPVHIGETTISEAMDRLLEVNADKNAYIGSPYTELFDDQKRIVNDWIRESLRETPSEYSSDHPKSYFLFKDSEIKAGLLLSEEIRMTASGEEGTGNVSLDYLYASPGYEKNLIRLLYQALNSLEETYADSTKISMMLSNEQSLQLFAKLLGKPKGIATVRAGKIPV